MPHPQEQEFREKLRVFLDDTPDDPHREYRMLLVYEPESGARFDYYYEDEDSGLSPHIRFNWMEADKREREIAARLGVRAPRKSKKEAVNPFTGEPLGPRTRIPEAKREVSGVDDELEVGMIVLREVNEVPDDRWLYITDVPEDQWDRPLPKPAVWPPRESASADL